MGSALTSPLLFVLLSQLLYLGQCQNCNNISTICLLFIANYHHLTVSYFNITVLQTKQSEQ